MTRTPEALLADLDRAIGPVRTPNPIVVAWRWRYEIGVLAAAIVLAPAFGDLSPRAVVGLTVLVALPFAAPQVRHLAWVRLRGIVLQHRMRATFRAARVHSATGRLPALLWTSPRSRADRVHLFLPSGLTAGSLAEQVERIAVATGGAYAEVLPTRYRFVVKLVIVRSQ